MTDARHARIHRSWAGTLALAAAAAALGGLAAFSYLEGSRDWGAAFLAIALGLLGALIAYGAFARAGHADCPSCAAPISGLRFARNRGILCARCRSFLESERGSLRVTPEDSVAERPLYGAYLPAEPSAIELPRRCCVCYAPATRTVELPARLPLGRPTTLGSGARFEDGELFLLIPHCADHDGGAALDPSGARPLLRFRSLLYLREYCDANDLQPVGVTGAASSTARGSPPR